MARRKKQRLWEAATVWERAVGVVMPKWVQLRVHRRLMSSDDEYRSDFHIAASLRGYKAAAPGKSKTPWIYASNRAADDEMLGDLATLRNRGRATQRDDPIGAGIVHTFVRKVVGTGIRCQVNIPEDKGGDKKNDVIEEVADSLLEKVDQANDLDYAGHQRLLYQRTLEDGDVLVREVVSEPGQPIWFEVAEADRIRTPIDAEPLDPRGRIVAGVEKDGYGRPVAYWVSKRHPGDQQLNTSEVKLGRQANWGPTPLSKVDFDRVPYDQAKLIRSRVTRPGQTRGLMVFHACLSDVHDLDQLILASMRRTQVAACIAMFIISDGDSVDLLDLTAEEYGYRLDQTLEPGMMFRLFPGEKAEFLNPTAGAPDLDDFVMLLVKRISAAVGLSPQSVLRAWEGVNYAGARTIKTDENQTIRMERASFVKQALVWERQRVLLDALMRGDTRLVDAGVTAEDIRQKYAEFVGDEEQWPDPQAEADSIEKMLEMGLTSPQIECARLGRDYKDVTRQRLQAEKMEKEMRTELGIKKEPAVPAFGKQPPAQPGAGSQDKPPIPFGAPRPAVPGFGKEKAA